MNPSSPRLPVVTVGWGVLLCVHSPHWWTLSREQLLWALCLPCPALPLSQCGSNPSSLCSALPLASCSRRPVRACRVCPATVAMVTVRGW